jgi:hypothetical protein
MMGSQASVIVRVTHLKKDDEIRFKLIDHPSKQVHGLDLTLGPLVCFPGSVALFPGTELHTSVRNRFPASYLDHLIIILHQAASTAASRAIQRIAIPTISSPRVLVCTFVGRLASSRPSVTPINFRLQLRLHQMVILSGVSTPADVLIGIQLRPDSVDDPWLTPSNMN